MDKEKRIIDSWKVNAENWIDIIEHNGIESRRLMTNKAIIEAVKKYHPKTVLDIGCGEGWLSLELNKLGIAVTGIDVIPGLIQKASEKVNGNFVVASYEDIANRQVAINSTFDAIVINFALIGKESTEQLLAALPGYLSQNGVLLIQTLHPYSRKQLNDYSSGWKQGSWDGLGENFTQPYEWYFRTLEDWLELLKSSGFKVEYIETFHPVTTAPLSVIFECRV